MNLRENLDGHLAVERRVEGPEHDPHPAAADELLKLVVPETLPLQQAAHLGRREIRQGNATAATGSFEITVFSVSMSGETTWPDDRISTDPRLDPAGAADSLTASGRARTDGKPQFDELPTAGGSAAGTWTRV